MASGSKGYTQCLGKEYFSSIREIAGYLTGHLIPFPLE